MEYNLDNQQEMEAQDLPDRNAQLAEAEVKVLLYRSLVKSPGWVELVRVIDTQVAHRTNDMFQSFGGTQNVQVVGKDKDGHDILAPIDGLTKIMVQEFEKGVRAGFLLVKDIPRASEELYSSIAQQIRAQMEAEQQKEEGNE